MLEYAVESRATFQNVKVSSKQRSCIPQFVVVQHNVEYLGHGGGEQRDVVNKMFILTRYSVVTDFMFFSIS